MKLDQKKIELTREQLRAIMRHEITFRDILGPEDPIEAVEFVCPQPYACTLEDLRCTVAALKASDPSNGEYGSYWFYPILGLSESFGIDAIRWSDENPIEGFTSLDGLLVTESDYFDCVWCDLEEAWEESGDEGRLSEFLDYDRELTLLNRYFRDQDKPIEEREWMDWEIQNFIRRFDDSTYVKKARDRELALCRKFVDRLCQEDSPLALHIKGYSCYGGDRLYPCDWLISRDCMLRLFEKTKDPQYANTLGYIFYYGRCSGGVPEYEKAFMYYSVAAASGLYEGMYKLADMFSHGYGCIKSADAARSLYSMVYTDSRRAFLKGENANFADIALRMGNVYAKGIGAEEYPEKAYAFYTEAAYASAIRMKQTDFFGDHTVAVNIQKALEETASRLPEDYFQPWLDFSFPRLFDELTEGNHLCELTYFVKDSGSAWLRARRIPTQREPKPDFILMLYPQIHVCERTREVTLQLRDEKQHWFKDHQKSVRYDFVRYSNKNGRIEFCYDREVTCWVSAGAFRLYAKHVLKPHGPEHTVVTVQFQPGGRTYDYLSELDGIQPGDTVVVNGYDGETGVTVVDVTVRKESELALPMEKYKKILRKAEQSLS